ncbi:MAG: hypothetical protein QXK49_03910 [Candidatus Aenigmatarchaeota archaeon]
MSEPDKIALFQSFVNIYTLCEKCKILQSKKIKKQGIIPIKYKPKPWQIGIDPYVDKELSTVLGKNIPPNIRGMIEEYKNKHFNYECKEAEAFSRNIYDTFKEILSKNGA